LAVVRLVAEFSSATLLEMAVTIVVSSIQVREGKKMKGFTDFHLKRAQSKARIWP
jgi:hypothetical protein